MNLEAHVYTEIDLFIFIQNNGLYLLGSKSNMQFYQNSSSPPVVQNLAKVTYISLVLKCFSLSFLSIPCRITTYCYRLSDQKIDTINNYLYHCI